MKTTNLKHTISSATLMTVLLFFGTTLGGDDYELIVPPGDTTLIWETAGWTGGPNPYPGEEDSANITRANGQNSFLSILPGERTIANLSYTGGTNQLRIMNQNTGELSTLIVTGEIRAHSGTLFFTKSGSSHRFAVDTQSLYLESGVIVRLGLSGAPIEFISQNTHIEEGAKLELGAHSSYESGIQLGKMTNLGTFDLGGGTGVFVNPYDVSVTSLSGSETSVVTTLSTGTGTNPLPTLRIQGGNTELADYEGVISDGVGQVSLTKEGSGVQQLSNANTYSGGTTISGGVLRVANTTGSALGTGAVNVTGGGTLSGNGIVALESQISVGNNGSIAPGAGSESGFSSLSLSGEHTGSDVILVMEEGSSFTFNLGAENASDHIEFTWYTAGDLVLNGSNILVNATNVEEGIYTLFSFLDANGDAIASGLTGGLAAGSGFDGYLTTFHFHNDQLAEGYGTISMEVSVIPEPAWMVGFMGILLGVWVSGSRLAKRRNSK